MKRDSFSSQEMIDERKNRGEAGAGVIEMALQHCKKETMKDFRFSFSIFPSFSFPLILLLSPHGRHSCDHTGKKVFFLS